MEQYLETTAPTDNDYAIVSANGKLPHDFVVPTPKFRDVVIALSPSLTSLSKKYKQQKRKELNGKLYNKCRPGFYAELLNSLHFAYAGQLDGHGKPHQWRLFCDDSLKVWLESFITRHKPYHWCADQRQLYLGMGWPISAF